jgi:hypothetical protein
LPGDEARQRRIELPKPLFGNGGDKTLDSPIGLRAWRGLRSGGPGQGDDDGDGDGQEQLNQTIHVTSLKKLHHRGHGGTESAAFHHEVTENTKVTKPSWE